MVRYSPLKRKGGILTRKDIISMSVKELRRVSIIHKVVVKELTQVKAAAVLGLSARQVGRIVRRVLAEGDRGLIHRSRGKPSNRMLPQGIKQGVLELYQQKYYDFGPTLANEKLLELEGIKLGTQTLRNWLTEAGLWQKRRKIKGYRQWRPRKECLGELVQMDGSHHDWLEGRGPELVLMGYIDDATSQVFARFYDYEGTLPAMDSFKGYAKRYGLPQSIYIDRLSAYKSTGKPSIEDELNGKRPMSQFERALSELGVRVIHAHSPQAKGRIERLFGTFQDRLIKEMRLKNIKTKVEANRFLGQYLPIYNQRFSVKPVSGADLHQDIPAGLDLDTSLCKKTRRTVRNDHTIAHNKKLYQLLERVNTKRVMLEERIDGSLRIKHNGLGLKFKEIASRPVKDEPTKLKVFKPKKALVPPKNHPWRNFDFKKADISNCA
jgi:transposase